MPDYLKYWAFQGMLRLERYEKGNKEKNIEGRFPERPTGKQRSVKMFPEVNDRGLRFIAQAFEVKNRDNEVEFRYDIPQAEKQKFLTALTKKDFRSLYGWTQENLPPISEDEMKITEGNWITYKQGSDPKILTESLQGKGSGWCIAGESLASKYLSGGNLNVFYTQDRDGKFTIPRVVIVQRDNRVTEVRGIEWEENVDDYIKTTDIIGNKLKELPGGEEFYETDKDTKQLTEIDKKTSSGVELTSDELVFLYEIDKPIKYFGIKKDPRIEEIRKKRNVREDMLIYFKHIENQIAYTLDEINENTKVYVGQLEPNIFLKLPHDAIDHSYFFSLIKKSIWEI